MDSNFETGRKNALSPISAENIERHLRVLTEEIGVRLAGSEGERRATTYLAEQGALLGARVSVEDFPVRERLVKSEQVEIKLGGQWQRFPCSLFSNTPGTQGQPVEVPICFFETPAESRRTDLSHLMGKGIVHLGTHIESRAYYARLIAAKPAFLMFVDIRYPGATPLADGMFPAYTRAFGAVPTVNVAYQDAWRWKVEGATAARLTVDGGMRDSTSHNVVLDLPGDGSSDELLLVGGHHDTQAGSVGGDDNGTGAVSVLELARVLAPRPRRRAIRLISFGAEEQLSVGSAVYVRRHRAEMERRARFMWNIDSIGSPLGWTQVVGNGSQAMVDYVLARFAQDDLWAVANPAVNPYSDHFPFVVAGVPSVFLIRYNCTAGRFFHHRPDDNLARVSCPLVARLLDCSAHMLDDLATRPQLPFPRQVEAEQAEKARIYWEDLFGGWEG